MLSQIVIEAEAPGNSQIMLRLSIDAHLIGKSLTAAQVQLLVAEILDRIPVAEAPLDGPDLAFVIRNGQIAAKAAVGK